ncbi:hypothetical protein, partial [Enterobacter cloacae]|uniref:hypothetical protein n=1 Tax=Enterobacter cloacae TaxID=550 RepID=UPI0019D41659
LQWFCQQRLQINIKIKINHSQLFDLKGYIITKHHLHRFRKDFLKIDQLLPFPLPNTLQHH